MLINPGHPYYYLRNFKFLVKREDVVLFYKDEPAAGAFKNKGKENPDTIRGTYDFELQGAFDFEGSPADISAAPIVGFSALGDNRRFKNDLMAYQLLDFKGFKDHHAFTSEDLANLDRWRKKHHAHYLVCTEKDFIKLQRLNLQSIPFIFVKNSIKFNVDLMRSILNHAKEENYI
jgi:tetraacyldisaccharide 4'-kinase